MPDSTPSSSPVRALLQYQTESRILRACLPFGPMSVNSMYRSIVRPGSKFASVIISEDGKAYRAKVAEVLDPCRAHYTKDEKVRIVIQFWRPDRRAFDADNGVKSLIDCLMHSDVIEDDVSVYELEVIKHDYDESKPDGETWIDILPIW